MIKFNLLGVSVTIGDEEQKPKRFGLKEARAAMKFVKESSQIKAVLGVVLGVLGYESTVASDVAQASSQERAEIEGNKADIKGNQNRIAILEDEIALMNADIAAANGNLQDLGEIQNLFSLAK